MRHDLEVELIESLQDAHTMESSLQQLLRQMILSAGDGDTKQRLERHELETRHHKQRLLERLQAHGENILGEPQPGGSRERMDGFMVARLNVAYYEQLEATAANAGDQETARVARWNRIEEELLARYIQQ